MRQQLLDQALRLSLEMTECGAAGDWPRVIDLESRRSALLANAFAQAAPADEATAQQINAILAADKRLMNISVTARDEAATELAGMQRGRKVTRAYRDAGA